MIVCKDVGQIPGEVGHFNGPLLRKKHPETGFKLGGRLVQLLEISKPFSSVGY